MERVEEAVGFEFDKWQGYQPNRSLLREYDITAIWLPTAQYEKLDKKLWRDISRLKFLKVLIEICVSEISMR